MSKDVPEINGCFEEWRSDYTDAKGMHCHRCPKCGTIWQHPSECAGSNKHHHCPKQGCRGEDWTKKELIDVKKVDFPWKAADTISTDYGE